MSTIGRLLSAVRLRLRSPHRDRPTDAQLLQFLYDRNQYYVNETKLTGQSWLIHRYALDVAGDSGVYPIPPADFAGPKLVTTDPEQYADQRRREVQIVEFRNLDMTNWADRTVGHTGAETDSVACMAFYRDQTGWKVQVAPANARGNYVLWYEPGFISDLAIENEPPMIKAFRPLLELSVAHDALPFCEWGDYTFEQNQATRAELRTTYMPFFEQLERSFRLYALNLNDPQDVYDEPYSQMRGGWDIRGRGL